MRCGQCFVEQGSGSVAFSEGIAKLRVVPQEHGRVECRQSTVESSIGIAQYSYVQAEHGPVE